MINANELRIGNKVYINIEDKSITKTIKGVDSWLVTFKERDDRSRTAERIEYVYPICITPEILESAGFEEVYKSKFTSRYELVEDTRFEAGWNLFDNIFYVGFVSERFYSIKYLHQLQNLIFSISQIEITINLQTITKCHTPKTEKKLLVKKITK